MHASSCHFHILFNREVHKVPLNRNNYLNNLSKSNFRFIPEPAEADTARCWELAQCMCCRAPGRSEGTQTPVCPCQAYSYAPSRAWGLPWPWEQTFQAHTGLRGAPCLRSCREEHRDAQGKVSPGSAPTEQLHRPSQPPGGTAGNKQARTRMDGELLFPGPFRAWMEAATHRCAAWVAKADRGEGCIYQCNSPVVGTN